MPQATPRYARAPRSGISLTKESMVMSKPKYCSIDLEFTGFDPETEQILEIGFAFFDVTAKGIVIGEKWSQVFKPDIEVHQKILGLTGISQEEIDAAPQVAEFREFLSEQLRDVTLVAHNPTLDVKFLEQAGVELSGRVIDTLELVQFLLPTHHSYNLENLMHYFSITHNDSHRALGDSLSTIALLEKLLGIHSALPKDLREQILAVCQKGQFAWTELLQYELPPVVSTGQDSLSHDEFADNVLSNLDDLIILDSELYLHESRVAKTLQSQPAPSLLVMSNKQEVLRLWRAGLVEGAFESKDLFNQFAFNSFLKTASTSEELRFALKILVWQATNWQTKTVLDLNLSFFGGQFKSEIVDGEYQPSSGLVAACDYETFTELAATNLETSRQLVICDLQRFERYLTFGSRARLSWNYFSFIVKSIYNPETGFGQTELSDQVVETLTAVDLFFGLVQIMLRQSSKQTDYIALAELQTLQPIYYHRLVAAAENLAERLLALGKKAEHLRLQDLAKDLTRFFTQEDNQVKWVELGDENVSLHSQPIRIKQIAQSLFGKYAGVKLTDTVSDAKLLFYLAERLGFNPENSWNQADLINLAHKEFSLNHIDELLNSELLTEPSAPLVIVFASAAAAKDFYKKHFLTLKEKFRLFGQEYSGSGNKIFRNFRISDRSMLLATSHFINKQNYTAPAKTVVYVKWPEIDSSQPYYQALLEEYQSDHPDLLEILGKGDYLLNIKQLTGKTLPKVFVLNVDLQKK